MFRLQCLVVCVLVYFAVADASAVSFVKACKPDDHPCHKASAIAAMPHMVAGVPELGIPSSDPLNLKDVNADDKDLKLRFTNIQVTGIKNCVVEDLIRDLDKSSMKMVLTCPLVSKGQYSLHGKLLFITAEGEGDFTIIANKVKIEAVLRMKTVESGGKKHWKITGYDYKFDLLEKASINLKNLFGGDETRSKPIHDLFDHSWRELITEVGAPINNQIFEKLVEVVKIFLKKMPVDKLELS
ncbi:uncharacterized protein [Epargyreus clarus]|uniref:uncharacterized protein n=1 Tax=Epargyreus clarus TaxID=520877 RepID=UPI003C30D9DE